MGGQSGVMVQFGFHGVPRSIEISGKNNFLHFAIRPIIFWEFLRFQNSQCRSHRSGAFVRVGHNFDAVGIVVRVHGD